MVEIPLVAICIATFKRPHYLSDLLTSLSTIEVQNFRAHIVVADNDSAETARPVIQGLEHAFPFPLTYIVEEKRGIPSARNRLFREAVHLEADFIAFVDDDQLVEPLWPSKLIHLAQEKDADAVAGRWQPYFEDGVPDWVRFSGFWDRPALATGEPAREFGTGNVLVRLSLMMTVPGPFDESRNLEGGTDALFFDEFHRRGNVTLWYDEPLVHERIPRSRATARWMLKRTYRVGLGNGHRFITGSPEPSEKLFFALEAASRAVKHSLLLLPSGLLGGRLGFVKRGCRLAEAAGRLGGLAGLRLREYAQTHGK